MKNKITKKEHPKLFDLLTNLAEMKTEHRKYSSFYAWYELNVTQELCEKSSIPTDLIGYWSSNTGLWSDAGGLEDSPDYMERTQMYNPMPTAPNDRPFLAWHIDSKSWRVLECDKRLTRESGRPLFRDCNYLYEQEKFSQWTDLPQNP